MRSDVAGIGVWGPGFSDYQQFLEFCSKGAAELGDTASPKPELIPPRERRRSPLMVKLAVEVADQACIMASVERHTVHCVFSSGIGDSELTDYMCRVLAGPDKLLSPTKFHNSVHNAAVGYWSISTGCEQAATFVASLDTSFSTALMESMVQVATTQGPVLLVLSDIPTPGPMWKMHPIDHTFAIGLVLVPADTHPSPLLKLSFDLEAFDTTPGGGCNWPPLSLPALEPLYTSSPSARALILLQTIADTAGDAKQHLQLPLSNGLFAHLTVQMPQTLNNLISER